jgi:hypothetical protein
LSLLAVLVVDGITVVVVVQAVLEPVLVLQ